MPLWEVWRQEWIQVCKPCLYTIWGTFFNKHNFINANVLCYAYSLSHGQLFVTPWSVAHQAPLSMGFPWQEYWSGLPCTPPGDLPNPGIELGSPALQSASSAAELLGKPINAHALMRAQLTTQWVLSCVLLFVTPWTVANLAPLSLEFFR